jgi:ppGpp synthetase/RelA/SpoT-type nucleotidyltranferase
MALRKDFLAMLGGSSMDAPSDTPKPSGIRKDFLDMLGGGSGSQPAGATPFIPSLPAPVAPAPAKPPERFLYNGLPAEPTVPRLPSLAELNRLDYTPATEQKPKEAPIWAQAPLGFVQGIVAVPAAAERSIDLIRYGLDRAASSKAPEPFLPNVTSLTREQGVAKLKADMAAKNMPAAKPVPFADEDRVKRIDRLTDPAMLEGFVGSRAEKGVGGGLYGIGQFVSSVLMAVGGGAAPVSLVAAGQAAKDAEQSGATKDEQLANALVVGTVTSVGFGKLGNAISTAFAKRLITPGVRNAALKMVATMGEGGLVNMAQRIAGNAVAKGTYDPNRQIANPKELTSDFVSGAVGAGVFHTPLVAGEVRNAISDARQFKATSDAMVRSPEAVPMSHVSTEVPAPGAEAMRQKALQKLPEFDQMISTVVNENGLAGVVRGGAKSVDSIRNKVERKANPLYTTESMKDHVRAAILVNDLSEVPALIESLKKLGDIQGEAFITEPLNNTGYRAIHLVMPMGDGVNGEIQVHTSEAWAIKKKSDEIYDKWRNVPYNKNNPEQEAARKSDYEESRAMWDNYFATVPDEVKRNASASVNGLALKRSPTIPLNGTQEPLTNIVPEASSKTFPFSSNENLGNIESPPTSSIPRTQQAGTVEGSFPESTPRNPETTSKWTPDQVEGMANGSEALPEDLDNLMTLADHVADLQDSGRMDLQHFASTVSQKVSQVYENTFKRNGLDKEFPEIFNAETFKYDPRTEKAQLQKAQAMINANPEGEFKRVTSLDGEEMTTDDVNVSGEMMKMELDLLRMNPENPDAIRRVRALADTLRQAGTNLGQGVQAFAKYSRRTPEGMTALANKLMDKVEESLPAGEKEKFDRETKAVEEATKKAEEEAAKKMADELDTSGELDSIIPRVPDKKAPTGTEPPSGVSGSEGEQRKKGTSSDGGYTAGPDEPTFAELLARKISAHAEEAKKGNGPDPIDDMLAELLRLAKESPIPDVNAAARKARNPAQFALQALDSWPRYKQVYADAQELLRTKYRDKPEMLARLESFFESDTRPPISTQTLGAIVRNGLNDVGIKMIDVLNNNDMRKKLINHIIQSTGAKGDPAMFLRNFLDERLNTIRAEFNKAQMKVKDPDARYRLLYRLYETSLKKEFVPSHLTPVLKGFVTGIDAKPKAAAASGRVSIGEIVRDYYATGKKKQGDIIDAIVAKTGLTGLDADNLRKQLYAKMAGYRKEYTQKAIDRLTAEKKISVKDPATFGKKLVELANEGALSNLAVRDVIREKFGLPRLEGKDITFILKEMDKYQQMPEGPAREALYENVLKYLGNKMPKSALKQFNSWRRMAMLLSARTHAANLLGNAANVGMQKVADTMAMGFEQFIPKDQRTKAILTSSDSHLVDMARQDFDKVGMSDMRQSGRYEVHGPESLARFGDTFKSKWLNRLSEFSKNALGAGDFLFYKPTYISSLAQYMKARGLQEVTPEARLYAKGKAEDVTLRKFSMLEAGVQAMKRGEVGKNAKVNAVAKGIGTGIDIMLPFLKTPGNILRRGAEFSPLGGFNVLAKIIGKESPAAIAEAAGKAFTGTFGAAFLGAWLTSIGAIDLDEYDGLYMVTPWGKYTIDWLQPISMSMAFGASMQKTLESKGYSGDAVLQSFMDGGDTLVNGSILRNFKDMLGGSYGGLSGVVASLPSQAINQSIPALAGQVARTIDPTVRSTYSPSKLVSQGKQIMAKTPGLSYLLPAKIDAMGQEMKQAGLVSQFLLPGRMVQEPSGPAAEEAKRLYDALKKTDPEAAAGVVLKPSPTKFDRNNEHIVLSAKELQAFAKRLGEERERLMDIQMSQADWMSLTNEEKAKRIKWALTKASDNTKDEFVQNRN